MAIFSYCSFQGKIYFNHVIFEKDSSFNQTNFNVDKTAPKTSIDFSNTIFKGESILFNDSEFGGQSISFDNCTFQNDGLNIEGVVFDRSNFSAQEISFDNAKFKIKLAYFTGCKFEGIITFKATEFIGCAAKFNDTLFYSQEILFQDNSFSQLSFEKAQIDNRLIIENPFFREDVTFEGMKLLDQSYFSLRKVRFHSENHENRVKIKFKNTIFPKLRTYFESIPINGASYPILTIEFEYCHLQDCYFIENMMHYFSFRHTLVKEIIFINNRWAGDSTSIKNILYDDMHINTKLNYASAASEPRRIRELYIQLKEAHDRNKDYENAGWFYFNQMEIIRKIYLYQYYGLPCGLIIQNIKFRYLKNKLAAFFFWIYKIISGYGQKPVRSFCFFLIALMVFAWFHLYHGFTKSGILIEYSFREGTYQSIWTVICDYSNAIVLAFSNILPLRNYFYGSGNSPYIPSQDFFGFVLSWFNTVILLAFVSLIFMGLKRQFKRY